MLRGFRAACGKRKRWQPEVDDDGQLGRPPSGRPGGAAPPGDEVRVVVGGVAYCTTRGSLSQCAYFAAKLDQESGFAPAGAVFSEDRDGELFRHLLAYMRTGLRPSRELLRARRAELLEEARFFGFDAFCLELEGSANYHKLRPQDRELRRQEEACARYFGQQCLSDIETADWERVLLVDVFAETASFAPADPEELMLPLLRPYVRGEPAHGPPWPASARARPAAPVDLEALAQPAAPSPLVVATVEAFRSRFDAFSDGLLRDLGEEAESGLVFAGGAVLGALCGKPASDVDIFLVGLDPAAGDAKLRRVLAAVKRNVVRREREDLADSSSSDDADVGQLTLLRSRLCVTAFRPRGRRRGGDPPPVQVVLTTYRSPLEVILNFDVDPCAVLYDPGYRGKGGGSRGRVLCLPRARRAMKFGACVVDTLFRSPSFERRLEKYARRGFAVAVPGFEEGALKPDLRLGQYFREDDQLLRIRAPRPPDGAGGLRPGADPSSLRPDGLWSNVELRALHCAEAEVIEGLERLVVLDRIRRGLLSFEPSATLFKGAKVFCRGWQGRVTLCKDLQYKRFNLDGTEEALTESDAEQAMYIVNRLLDKENRRVATEARLDAPAFPGHHLEESAGLRLRDGSDWEIFARKRRQAGKCLWFVMERTRLADEAHTDLRYFWDAGAARCWRPSRGGGGASEADLAEEEFEHRVGVPRRLQFHTTTARPVPFGWSGGGAYHKEKGDWFADVYEQ